VLDAPEHGIDRHPGATDHGVPPLIESFTSM
jgi:hypothetical protein